MPRDFKTRGELVERRFASSPSQVAQRAQWNQRRARLKAAAGRQRQGLVKVDPELQKTIAAFIDQVAPEVARAFNRHLVPMAQEEYKRWPIDSGFSRSVLSLSFRPVASGAAFLGELINPAPYAGWIERGALARRLFARGDQAAERMAIDLARKIGR